MKRDLETLGVQTLNSVTGAAGRAAPKPPLDSINDFVGLPDWYVREHFTGKDSLVLVGPAPRAHRAKRSDAR